MTNSLRVLIIDDSEDDARRIAEELQCSDFDPLFERVNSPETMKVALEQKTWDVVISNFSMAKFTGLEALQEKELDLPFIIISDAMSEDIAREAMKAGAHAFFKKKNIRLLVPAVERGLREATIKRERKQAEELFKSLATNSPVGAYIVQKGKFVYANSQFQQYSGYREDELSGMEALSLVIPEDRETVRNNAAQMLKGKRVVPYEFRITNKNGEIKWALEAVASIQHQGKQATIGSYQDITERKQAEQRLRESETRYRQLIETMNEALAVTDTDFRLTFINEQFCTMLGCSRNELIGRRLSEFVHEDFREILEDQLERRKTGEAKTYELAWKNKAGKIIYTLASPKVLLDDSGNFLGSIGVLTDITELKRTENQLRENEKNYRSLYQEFQGILNAIPDTLCLISSDLKIVWANERSAELFNKNLPDIIEKYCYQVWHNRTEPCEVCPAQRSFRSKMPEFEEVSSFDGRIWELRVVPIIDDRGKVKGVVELARDITQKEKAAQEMSSLQEQLRQAQKMEAIGRLAGGIAHDFNNLLTVIQVNSELALYELANNDSLKLRVDDIKTAAERAANLTRQLLAFSRRQVFNLKVINLNFILEDLEKMLHRIIGEEIELITAFADDLGRVKADPGEIEQVIINLAVNAKDAMPHGGTLTIATANVELEEQYVQRHLGTLPGSYIVISVTDTGVGIPKEIHEQIFDPFFTTKEKGKGTGLGLATVYGIVKQSGGDVHLYSEPGKGTTFKVYLPRVDEPLEEAEKKQEAEVFPRGSETILVVEDDSSVRKIAVQVLTNQGYNVLVSESGGDALLICEQEKHPIHLVLTDVVMPKMSGPDLIERLKKVRKDFAVLYMSGYTDKYILKGLSEKLNFIQKPFTVDVLAKKVRAVLDG